VTSSREIFVPSQGLPDILPGPSGLSEQGMIMPSTNDISQKQLHELLKIWRRKRDEYPGWVIASKHSRDEIWRYTEYWIELVLNAIDKLQPPNNLFLLYELNWRLETTLTPLFMNWVDKITPIINTFNPYPGQVEIEKATIRPDKDEYKNLDWERIGKYWVDLIFALARESREDQDEKRFDKWINIIKDVVKRQPDWQARWYYEKCLFYLFRFNQQRLRDTLEEWPISRDLPFWGVKRASILAELGQLNDAENIAENSLQEIRSRNQPYSPNYSQLSKEGWTMVLLKALKDNKNLIKWTFPNPYRDRWEELRSYRCNPLEEIELLGSLVKGEKLVSRPTRKIRKKFDPGRAVVTQHLPSGISVFRPAFSFLRMFEEGALPMKCGSLSMFSDSLVSSAKSIEPYAPFWALSTMVRGGKKEEFKEWFDRISVATLPKNEVEQLFALVNSLKQAINDLIGNPQKLNLLGSSFSQRQVLFLSELISRLCFRFSIKQINQVYQLTVSMYKMTLFQEYYILHSCVDVLLKRLLHAMSQAEILKRMPELLSLPIPSEDGFEVRQTQSWPEPFRYIRWLEDTKLDSNFNRTNWTEPISHLIRIIKTGTSEARKRALSRLIKIYKINGLSKNEVKDFGEALWSRVNSDKGLPSDTDLFDFEFLTLPEKEEGKAKDNLRKYLLSKELPKIIQYSINSEGKKSFRVPFSSSFNLLIQELLNATLLPLTQDKKEEQKFINWTSEEAVELLNKVSKFWNKQKRVYIEAPKSLFFDFKDTFEAQFLSLMDLMAQVILPRLKGTSTKYKNLATKLLNEMDKENLTIIAALPSSLFIDKDLYDKIAKRIRFGLNSLEEREVYGSISGLFYWLVYSRKKQIPDPPDDLLNELVNKVLTRCQPGLNFAIRQIAVIIKKFPECFNDNQIESLYIALEYLIKETELPDRRFIETVNESTLRIPISDRPEYRKLTAELAYQLYKLLKSRNEKIPMILSKWREISKNDPLPEVRWVWGNHEVTKGNEG